MPPYGKKSILCLLLLSFPNPVESHEKWSTERNPQDLDIQILGSIHASSQGQDSVLLIKELKTRKVKALKKGYPFLRHCRIASISQKSVLIFSWKTKEYFSLYFDNFIPSQREKKGPAPDLKQNNSYREEGFDRYGGRITLTKAYKNNILQKELPKILMQASSSPFMEDGHITGFSMDWIQEGSIYEKAGLQKGDIIRSINGKPLNDVASTIQLLQSLRGASKASLSLERGGEEQEIQVEVK